MLELLQAPTNIFELIGYVVSATAFASLFNYVGVIWDGVMSEANDPSTELGRMVANLKEKLKGDGK